MCLRELSEGPDVGGEDMEMVFGTGVQILQWGDSELPAQGSVAMESPGQHRVGEQTPCAEPGSAGGPSQANSAALGSDLTCEGRGICAVTWWVLGGGLNRPHIVAS